MGIKLNIENVLKSMEMRSVLLPILHFTEYVLLERIAEIVHEEDDMLWMRLTAPILLHERLPYLLLEWELT